MDHLQQREEHWAIVDLMGKGGHVRTFPVPDWVKSELEVWIAAAGINRGRLFRRVNKVGKAWGEGMMVKAVWHILKESAKCIGVPNLAPHDLHGPVLDSAMDRAGSWSRSNSFWATSQFKAPNGTLGASSEFDQPSMIALGSSRTLDVAEPVVEGLPTNRPRTGT
jgi:hypothetical protein